MADDDKVHIKVVGQFRSAYRQLVAGKSEPLELALSMLKCLKERLKHYGDAPVNLVTHVADELTEKLNSPLFHGLMDPEHEMRNVEQLRRNMYERVRGLDIAQDVCLDLIMDVAREGPIKHSSLKEEGVRRYLAQVLEADFSSVVDQAEPHSNAELSAIRDRLQETEEFLPGMTQGFVSHLVKDGSVETLRLPPVRGLKPVSLDDVVPT